MASPSSRAGRQPLYLVPCTLQISAIGTKLHRRDQQNTDIDEQQQRETALIELSERDCLAGLLNKLSSENRICERMKSCGRGTLFMIDINDFRSVNNSCGHECGDRALIYVAEYMRCVFRADDILGRFGGDEMTVFAAGTTDKAIMQKRTEFLISQLSLYSGDSIDSLSCSIGIASFPDD